ncbi:hypothetical protein PIB30_054337 [Stylosanthes scabra]|uniref:Uncharacterized protein n=1 Tax=Stylosanthes scabra TaxID=79078 RepID=A0ABU6VH86_9FABA|nr:hypothetical protein [Stylosanthes scabra]
MNEESVRTSRISTSKLSHSLVPIHFGFMERVSIDFHCRGTKNGDNVEQVECIRPIQSTLAQQVEEASDCCWVKFGCEQSRLSLEVVPPTSSAVPDSSSARDTSATPSPSIVSTQEVDNRNKEPPQTRKRKNFKPKYGLINSKEFDHVGFAQEYLVGGNNKIPMDGENFLKNLDFVTRSSIKAVAICQAAKNKMRGCVLVLEGEVEQLRVRVKAAETDKRVIEGEKFELSSKVSNLEAR